MSVWLWEINLRNYSWIVQTEVWCIAGVLHKWLIKESRIGHRLSFFLQFMFFNTNQNLKYLKWSLHIFSLSYLEGFISSHTGCSAVLLEILVWDENLMMLKRVLRDMQREREKKMAPKLSHRTMKMYFYWRFLSCGETMKSSLRKWSSQ